MRKSVVLLSLLLFLTLPAFAWYFDLALTLGTNVHMFEKDLDPSRMKMAWGASVGLTDVWEFDVQVDTQLVPTFFGSSSISLVGQKALLGQRSTGSSTAGVGINTLVGAGVMISPYTSEGTLGISHLLLTLTPLTVGSPVTGKRERLFALTLAYNLSNQKFALLFDLVKYDFYAIGTYRDYR